MFFTGAHSISLLWDVLSISSYLFASIVYLYLPLIPDIAAMRDNDNQSIVYSFYNNLALNWRVRSASKAGHRRQRYNDHTVSRICSYGGVLCFCHERSAALAFNHIWPLLCYWRYLLGYCRSFDRYADCPQGAPFVIIPERSPIQIPLLLANTHVRLMVLRHLWGIPRHRLWQ